MEQESDEIVEVTVHGTEQECRKIEGELMGVIPNLIITEIHKGVSELGKVTCIYYELELGSENMYDLDAYISANDKVTW